MAGPVERLHEDADPRFPAPSGPNLRVDVREDGLTVEASRLLRVRERVALLLFGVAFAAVPALFFLAAGPSARPVLLFALVGLLLMAAAFLPGTTERVTVGANGLETVRIVARRETRARIDARAVAAVRFARATRVEPATEGRRDRVVTEWRVGARLADGRTIGVLLTEDRGLARAVAEAAHRALPAAPLLDESGDAREAPGAGLAAPPGAPAGWPAHPRFRVEERADGVLVVPLGRHWRWFAALAGFFGLFTLGFGVVAIGLPVLAYRGLGSASVAVQALLLAFALGSAGVSLWAARGVRGAWRTFVGAPPRHLVTRDELVMEAEGAPTVRVPLADVERVRIERGNVVLAARTGDVVLAFHRLSRAEDLEWARTAIEHAVARARAGSTRS